MNVNSSFIMHRPIHPISWDKTYCPKCDCDGDLGISIGRRLKILMQRFLLNKVEKF